MTQHIGPHPSDMSDLDIAHAQWSQWLARLQAFELEEWSEASMTFENGMVFTSTPGKTIVGLVDGKIEPASDDSTRRELLTLKITSDEPMPKPLSDVEAC